MLNPCPAFPPAWSTKWRHVLREALTRLTDDHELRQYLYCTYKDVQHKRKDWRKPFSNAKISTCMSKIMSYCTASGFVTSLRPHQNPWRWLAPTCGVRENCVSAHLCVATFVGSPTYKIKPASTLSQTSSIYYAVHHRCASPLPKSTEDADYLSELYWMTHNERCTETRSCESNNTD